MPSKTKTPGYESLENSKNKLNTRGWEYRLDTGETNKKTSGQGKRQKPNHQQNAHGPKHKVRENGQRQERM